MRAKDFILQAAEVLEKAAMVLDASEAEKTASEKQARAAEIETLAKKYQDATGEELDAEIREKLASDSGDVRSIVQKMTEKMSSTVESMGRASGGPKVDQPVSREDRRKAAWENFGTFINS